MRAARSSANAKLQVVLLLLLMLIVGLWTVTIVLSQVPNNRLHEMGLGNAIAIDVSLGVLVAICIAIVSLRFRASSPVALFVLVQVLAWGHSVGLWLFLIVMAFIAAQHGL
jgi:hypothetical protein